MEALDMLLSRRSVKRFAPDVLPAHSDLQRIADAGANAPTGRGRQSPFIVVVTDRAVRDQLSRLNAEILGRDGDPFYGARWSWSSWPIAPNPPISTTVRL